jgi:hypothetical protein
MFVGAGANVATQFSNGRSFSNFDRISFGISTLAGGIGAGVGTYASKYLQVPMKHFSSIDTIGFNWLNASDKIVSATIGGSIGAGLDLGGHHAYSSFEFDSNMVSSNAFDSSSKSFSDSFSDSWWNQ